MTHTPAELPSISAADTIHLIDVGLKQLATLAAYGKLTMDQYPPEKLDSHTHNLQAIGHLTRRNSIEDAHEKAAREKSGKNPDGSGIA